MLEKEDIGRRFVEFNGLSSYRQVTLAGLSECGKFARVRWLCFWYWTPANKLTKIASKPSLARRLWRYVTKRPEQYVSFALGIFIGLEIAVLFFAEQKPVAETPPGDRSVRVAAKP